MCRLRTLSTLLLCTVATAQGRTFVVDQAMGPGADFADLPPAVAQARTGDRILVRDGRYSGFTTIHGISIVATGAVGAVAIDGGVTVQNLLSTASFAMRGVTMTSTSGPSQLHVQSCRGPVHLQDVHVRTSGIVVADGNSQVTWTRCSTTDQTLQLTGSNVLVDDSTFVGSAPARNGFAMPALILVDAQVQLSRTSLTGGARAPAIELFGSSVDLTDDGSNTIRVGAAAPTGTPAIHGPGTVTIAPAVVLVPADGAPPIDPRAQVVPREIPSLRVPALERGAVARLDVFGTPGAPFAVVVGLPAFRVVLPGLLGRIWIDLSGPLGVVASGTLPVGDGRSLTDLPVPDSSALVGFALRFQGIAGIVLSNPATGIPD